MNVPACASTTPPSALRLDNRVAALEAAFSSVARTRMAGVPVLNPTLCVRAVGFAPHTEPGAEDAAWALGVLITPWFMNLVRLPLSPSARVPAVGSKALRQVGAQALEFIGGHEAAVGPFEACSLFSPMFEFADQAAAEAVAREVLGLVAAPAVVRVLDLGPNPTPVAPVAPVNPLTSRAAPTALSPARRSFFLGRGPAGLRR